MSHNESTLKLSLQAGSNASTIALALSAWNVLLHTKETPSGPLGDWTMGAWLDIGKDPKQNLHPNAIQDICAWSRVQRKIAGTFRESGMARQLIVVSAAIFPRCANKVIPSSLP